MMVRVFTKNRNDKIELTETELKELLDEAYWEGYRSNSNVVYTYTTPNYWHWPYNITSDASSTTVTFNSSTNNTTTTSYDTSAERWVTKNVSDN